MDGRIIFSVYSVCRRSVYSTDLLLFSLRPPLSPPFSASSVDNLEYFYPVKVEPSAPPAAVTSFPLPSLFPLSLSHLKQDLTDLMCC